MIKSKLLQWLLAPFFMYVDEVTGGGGGAVDRGDDFDPEAGTKLAGEAAAKEVAASKLAEEEAAKAAKEAEDKTKADEEAAKTKGGDEEDGDAEKDGDKDKRKDTRIPLSRHKQLLERERENNKQLAAKLAQYEKDAGAEKTSGDIRINETKITELEEKYAKELADGKLPEATKIMGEIRKLEREIGDKRATLLAREAESNAIATVTFNMVLNRIEEAFPALNPDHDDFDEAKTEEVNVLVTAFKVTGLSPAAALQKAVKYVMGEPETKKQETAVDKIPKAAKDDVAAQRKKEAIERNVDAANKTPASTAKVGVDSDKIGGAVTAINIMKMSQAEFSKLTEAQLQAARGDAL